MMLSYLVSALLGVGAILAYMPRATDYEIPLKEGYYAVYRVEVSAIYDVNGNLTRLDGEGTLSWRTLEISGSVALVEVSSNIGGLKGKALVRVDLRDRSVYDAEGIYLGKTAIMLNPRIFNERNIVLNEVINLSGISVEFVGPVYLNTSLGMVSGYNVQPYMGEGARGITCVKYNVKELQPGFRRGFLEVLKVIDGAVPCVNPKSLEAFPQRVRDTLLSQYANLSCRRLLVKYYDVEPPMVAEIIVPKGDVEEEICALARGYDYTDGFYDAASGLLVRAYTFYDPLLVPLGATKIDGLVELVETNIGSGRR